MVYTKGSQLTTKHIGTEHEELWNKSKGELQSTKGVGSQLCEKERNNQYIIKQNEIHSVSQIFAAIMFVDDCGTKNPYQNSLSL